MIGWLAILLLDHTAGKAGDGKIISTGALINFGKRTSRDTVVNEREYKHDDYIFSASHPKDKEPDHRSCDITMISTESVRGEGSVASTDGPRFTKAHPCRDMSVIIISSFQFRLLRI